MAQTIVIGDKGDEVGAMQQQLTEAGYAVPQEELDAREFLDGTYAALRSFQAAHVDQNGHALLEDGKAGPATQWALAHPGATGGRYTAPGWRCSPSDAPKALAPMISWAQGMIGTREDPDGSNRSPVIDEWTGMKDRPAAMPGPPWCAAFVSYAYRMVEGGSPFGFVLSALKLYTWAQQAKRVLSPSAAAAPIPGDVFVILRGDGHGHVGLIVELLPDGRVCTIEGNSGNAVRGLVRDRGQFKAIVRPVQLF